MRTRVATGASYAEETLGGVNDERQAAQGTDPGNDVLRDLVGHDVVGPDGAVHRWVNDPTYPWGGCWRSRGRRLNNATMFRAAGINTATLRAAGTS